MDMVAMEFDWTQIWPVIAGAVTLIAGVVFYTIRSRVQKVQAALVEIADLVVKTTAATGQLAETVSLAMDDNQISPEEVKKFWADVKEIGRVIRLESVQAGNSIRAIFQK